MSSIQHGEKDHPTPKPVSRTTVRCFNFHPWKRSGDDVGGCRVDLDDGVETNTHRLKLT